MKLHVLSDLHIEFAPFEPPPTEADIVILAGDTHVGIRGVEWAKQAFPKQPVLYVLGNHEYYGQALPKIISKLRTATEGSNVTVLENDLIVIDDVTFFGCTLWTDFRLLNRERIATYIAQTCMNDFKQIRVSPQYRHLRPTDTMALHLESKRLLQEAINSGTQIEVIITHHAPSGRSIPSAFGDAVLDDLLKAAYASALEKLVVESGAKVWVHGHLHTGSEYQLGNTRVICNPRGYPSEEFSKFKAELVIEVGKAKKVEFRYSVLAGWYSSPAKVFSPVFRLPD